MKSEEWTSALLISFGLLHGVLAPATYLIRNLDQTGSHKSHVYAHGSSVGGWGKRVYPANTEYVHPERDLTSEFIREISEIKIPNSDLPAQIPVFDKNDEEGDDEGDTDYDRNPQDYERVPADYERVPSDYDRAPLDYDKAPADYSFSNDEYSETASEPSPAFRDYGESESTDFEEEMLSKYKVTEKIPDDNKYKPPKVKVVPVPPPCLRPAPPPPPKPKPPPTEYWADPGRPSPRPYRILAAPSNRYRRRRKPKRVALRPVIVTRHFHPPEGTTDVVIRHHTILPPPPPPPRKPKVVKEVHIHHHHGLPHPNMVPIAVHIHKDALDNTSSEPEEKQLDMNLRPQYYNQVASPSGPAPVSAVGSFAEPPSFHIY